MAYLDCGPIVFRASLCADQQNESLELQIAWYGAGNQIAHSQHGTRRIFAALTKGDALLVLLVVVIVYLLRVFFGHGARQCVVRVVMLMMCVGGVLSREFYE